MAITQSTATTRKRRRPFFKTHDYVEFEMDKKKVGPRWKLNVDTGGCGEYAKGIITDLELRYIQLDAIFPDGHVRTIRFPNYASSDYDIKQWTYSGYLKHVDVKKPSCECGMGNKSGTHYMFCPMFDHLQEQDRKAREKRKELEEAERRKFRR